MLGMGEACAGGWVRALRHRPHPHCHCCVTACLPAAPAGAWTDCGCPMHASESDVGIAKRFECRCVAPAPRSVRCLRPARRRRVVVVAGQEGFGSRSRHVR